MTRLAVVILNYNGKGFLEYFLPFHIKFSKETEIIVVDNGSTDDSVEFLESTYPAIRLIKLAENFGFAGGYNQALQQIEFEYVAIINSDVEVTHGWWFTLVHFLEENPEFAAVQPKILDYSNRQLFEYAGASGGFIDTLGYPYCRGRIFDSVEEDFGQYNNRTEVDWTSGACMVIRKSVFDEMEGFDADFFAHMEEIDLCWRIRAKGHKLACLPESVVYHIGGGTLSKNSPRKTYLNFRNGLSLLLKNLPPRELIWKLPLRLVLDGIAAVKFSIDVSPAHLMAILKAHLHFYVGMKKDWKKRKETLSSGRFSVLVQFFLNKKRTFSELINNTKGYYDVS